MDSWLMCDYRYKHPIQASPYPLTTWHRREEEVTLDPTIPQFRIQEVTRAEANALISCGSWCSLTPVPCSGFFLCKPKLWDDPRCRCYERICRNSSVTSLPLQVQETGSPLTLWEYILLQVRPHDKISCLTHTAKASLSSLWCLHYAFSNLRHFHLIVRPCP